MIHYFHMVCEMINWFSLLTSMRILLFDIITIAIAVPIAYIPLFQLEYGELYAGAFQVGTIM